MLAVIVPAKGEFERTIERRIAAHVRAAMVERNLGTTGIAKKLGVHKSYISRLLNEFRGADAAFVAKMHSRLGISANVLLDEDPPERFWRIGPPALPLGDPSPPSRAASRSTAQPGKQKAGGGNT